MREEIEEGLAIPADDAVLASGKTGEGVHDLLEAVVYNIPAPVGDADAPLRALIFDSYFDPYRGVVALVRVVDGAVKKGDRVLMMATGTEVLVEEVGARRPAETPLPEQMCIRDRRSPEAPRLAAPSPRRVRKYASSGFRGIARRLGASR